MITNYVVTALVAAIMASIGVWNVQNWRYAAKDADRIEQVQEKSRMDRLAANNASKGHETDKAKVTTEFITITERVDHVIEKPSYRLDCFDADGLRAHADSVRLTGNPGEPVDPLPHASAPR